MPERCDDENYQTAEAAKSSLFEYLEGYYYRLRKHSTINYMAPAQFEDTRKNDKPKCPKNAG
ncbi:MAG: IS3 family transposase [Francisellaceae bacterium]